MKIVTSGGYLRSQREDKSGTHEERGIGLISDHCIYHASQIFVLGS